jgi:GNAT superfamily N-acetyltransferase
MAERCNGLAPKNGKIVRSKIEYLRYFAVPVLLDGCLAVDQAFKGQGLGGALLADAPDRAARSEVAAYALMVDAKDEAAAAFYRQLGFIALPDLPLTLFLSLATALASGKTDHAARD